MRINLAQRVLLVIVLLSFSFEPTLVAFADPPTQDTPWGQCAEGVRLFNEGQASKALPLLESGFVGRKGAAFANPNDLGKCALALGMLREQTGDLPGSLEAYLVALDIFQGSDRGFEGAALSNLGHVYHIQGRYVAALEYYQRALTTIRELGEREVEGVILNNIGGVYSDQGQYAEALGSFQQALVIARDMNDTELEGTTLNNIGGVYREQEQYADALETLGQALDIVRSTKNRALEGTVLNAFGAVYAAQGRYTQALEMFQQSLVIMREVGDRLGEGSTLNNIGETCVQLGRYQEALDVYQQALTITREVGYRLGEGKILAGIGVIYSDQGRYSEALETLQQALNVVHGAGNVTDEANLQNSIGIIYQRQGRYIEALETLGQAFDIAANAKDKAGQAATLNNKGLVYKLQGQFTQALDTYQQALDIARELSNQLSEGTTLYNIAGIYEDQRRYVEALDIYQRSLAIRRQVGDRLGEGATLNSIGLVYEEQGRYEEASNMYQQALAIQRELGDRAGEGVTLANVGVLYERQEKLDQALSYFDQAMNVFESVRAIAGSEQGRSSFIAQYADLYARVATIFHKQGRDEEAFFTSERGRARAFLDSLATGYVELSDKVASNLLAREQEAYATRRAAQDAISRAHALNPPDPALVADLENEFKNADENYQSALAAIEARGGQLAALVPGRSTVLDLTHVQALLDGQTTLVSFWVMENQTLAFIITRNAFHATTLEVKLADLITQIRAFRAFPNLDVAHPESAVQLYRWVIEPLKSYLTTPHLVFLPQSVLHYLPIAALTDGKRYLLDDYVISYLPSASALPFIQANTGRKLQPPLILGNPTTQTQLPSLAFAQREAQAIGKLYSVEPLLGTAATESAVKEKVTQAGILHLAAHGVYNPVNPLNSAISLAPDKNNDGWLEVQEVYGLNLKQTDLVVLSACETQLGELGPEGQPVGVSAGDEVVGLTRAFFFADTPSVIATLWSADDQPTEMLMERFYTYLRAGKSKGDALRQAQLDMRAKYPNPYYWSGFVLSGDSGVEGQPQTNTSTPAAGLSTFCPSAAVLLLVLPFLALTGVRRLRKGERLRDM